MLDESNKMDQTVCLDSLLPRGLRDQEVAHSREVTMKVIAVFLVAVVILGWTTPCVKASLLDEPCDGEIVNCIVPPCQVATCPNYPDAECVDDYCNGCNARFFVRRCPIFLREVTDDCNNPEGCKKI